MNKKRRQSGPFISIIKNQRGVTAVVVAIMLPVLIAFVALAIDVGYIAATKNELQNVADSAALAATGQLGAIYNALTYDDLQLYTVNPDDIVPVAQSVVGDGGNQAAGIEIAIRSEDVYINTWAGTVFASNDYNQPNAVRVIARRDGIANNPITTFFAWIFQMFGGDFDTIGITADATAALTGPAVVAEGELKLPIGLSINQFLPEPDCTDIIRLSPTTDSCAGWHNFFDSINANAMAEKLIGFIKSDPTDLDIGCLASPCGDAWLNNYFTMGDKTPDAALTPETGSNDVYEFQGGTIASLFLGGHITKLTPEQLEDPAAPIYSGDTTKWTIEDNADKPAPFIALFEYFRFRDGDGDDTMWTTAVPVYADDEICINPNTGLEIVGFATVHVIMPNPPPDSTVEIQVDCLLSMIEGRGGGGTFGPLKGTIPGLVE
jgi:Flp pilus assembly protein TadG